MGFSARHSIGLTLTQLFVVSGLVGCAPDPTNLHAPATQATDYDAYKLDEQFAQTYDLYKGNNAIKAILYCGVAYEERNILSSQDEIKGYSDGLYLYSPETGRTLRIALYRPQGDPKTYFHVTGPNLKYLFDTDSKITPKLLVRLIEKGCLNPRDRKNLKKLNIITPETICYLTDPQCYIPEPEKKSALSIPAI